MAWAEELPSGKWRACWRDDAGRKQSSTGPKKLGYINEEAAKRVGRQEEAKARAGLTPDSGRTMTWGQWLPLWRELRRVEPSTAQQDAVRIRRYLQPQWERTRLNRIKRGDIQRWVNDLAVRPTARAGSDGHEGEVLSPAYVARIYHLFTASMRAAVHDGQLATSPCVGIKVQPPGPGKERYLTRAEVDAIVHHTHVNDPQGRPAENRADSRMYRCLVTVATETGLRFGELAGLHWWRVDLDQGVINVIETWDPANRKIKAYPKGKRSRAVPISDRCLDALSAMLAHCGDRKTCGLTHTTGRCRSPLVFMTARGAALDAHNYGRRQWADACHRAEVEGATPHDMRHTYASWLTQRGRTLKEVQELFGHRTVNMTYRYVHPSTANRRQAVAVLDCLRSPRSTWCAWQKSNLRIRSSLADLVEGALP